MQEDDPKSQQSLIRYLIEKSNNILENINLKQIKRPQFLNKNYLNSSKENGNTNLNNFYLSQPIDQNEQRLIHQNQNKQCSEFQKYSKLQNFNQACLQLDRVGDERIEQAAIKNNQLSFRDEQVLKNIYTDKIRNFNQDNLSQETQNLDLKQQVETPQSIQRNNLIESLKKSLIQRQLQERIKQFKIAQEKNNIQSYLKVQENFKTTPKTLEDLNQHGGKQQIQNKRSIDPSIDVQQNFFKQGVKKSTPIKNVKINEQQASCDSFSLKGNYYFKTQSKNGLEAMQQAIENKQKTLRIVCGECKKDSSSSQIFKKDKNIQAKKKINQVAISSNSQQFQKNMQNPEFKQVLNPIHLKRNYSENFSNDLKFSLSKSQSGKNLLQKNETDKQKIQLSIADRQLTKPSEGFSFEQKLISRSTLDENYQNYLSSISSQLKNKSHQKTNHSDLSKTKDNMKSQDHMDEIYGPWDINQFDTDSNCFPSQVSITNLHEYKNQF
ncbi:hypothetical protein ABPG74_005830 [Tetrahymena malaccensis]